MDMGHEKGMESRAAFDSCRVMFVHNSLLREIHSVRIDA